MSFKTQNADPTYSRSILGFCVCGTWPTATGKGGSTMLRFSSCHVPTRQKACGPEQHKRTSRVFLASRTTVRGSHDPKCTLPTRPEGCMNYSLNCTRTIGSEAAGAEAPKAHRTISEDIFASGKCDSEVVNPSDIVAEYSPSGRAGAVDQDGRIIFDASLGATPSLEVGCGRSEAQGERAGVKGGRTGLFFFCFFRLVRINLLPVTVMVVGFQTVQCIA